MAALLAGCSPGTEEVPVAAAAGRVLAEDVVPPSACRCSPTPRWTATPPAGPRSGGVRRGTGAAAGRRGPPGRAHRRPRPRAGHGAPHHDRRPGARRRRRGGPRGHRRRHRAGHRHASSPAAGASCGTPARTSPGTLALPAGTVLGPPSWAWPPRSAGRRWRRRRPRVLVLSTGSELVPPASPGAGQIHESNSLVLAAASTPPAAPARTLHFVPDDVGQFLTPSAPSWPTPTC